MKYINQRGGLNGHTVKFLLFDDGADPARHRAQVQEAIEQRGAIAFLANAEGLSGRSSVEYITSKRVPVIGSEGAYDYFYQSPMYFPQMSHSDGFFYGAIGVAAGRFVPAGKTKLGTMTCVEVEGCARADALYAGWASSVGFRHVYRGRASISQPDFTAECLAARNAGVEVWLVLMDTNSLGRLGSACARQGFRPSFATLGSIQRDTQKDDPNLVGMVAASPTFPYFQSGTPATDEFQLAMRTVGGGVVPGLGVAQGWVAGKVLEKAAANLSEPPSSESILAGLWTIKEDTLGGITNPLTFTENKPATRRTCWFAIRIAENHAWTSPDGFQMDCRK